MTEILIRRDKKNLGFHNAAALIKKAVQRTLQAEGISEDCIFSALLTDDEGIRNANREFRDSDTVTDVLSFPMAELIPGAFDPSSCERDPETGRILLGDMMINLSRCAQQGEEYGHGFARELQYLTVHSVLHLLGYDHVDEGEKKRQMRQREKEIMEEI